MKRVSLLRDWGKGHLSAVTNSLSTVTFIIVPFISVCHHFTPLFKQPRGWQGVTPNRCMAKDLYLLLKIHKGLCEGEHGWGEPI